MIVKRRTMLAATAAGALAAPWPTPWIGGTARDQARQLKISHQFPGGTIDSGDFRDQLCRRFAAEIAKRTNGALTAEVYPGSSLVKTVAQYSALRRGALDLSLYPLAYAGGEVPETNLGLMPALVTNYDQAAKWKASPVGRELAKTLDAKGVIILTCVWQSGGVASRAQPVVVPEDVKGMKIRGEAARWI